MKKLILTILFIGFLSTVACGEDLTDYLILQDIGRYKVDNPIKFRGGMVGGQKTNSIGNDAEGYCLCHTASYSGGTGYAATGVEACVYQSAEWLLHNLEGSFRGETKKEWLGESLLESATIREIDGHKIFDYGYVDYRWLSGNVVVRISYTDLEGNKPEPLEVVKAYLQKFPSSIQMTDVEAHSRTHNEKWIRDEMSRRLWLSDKWAALIQPSVADLHGKLEEIVESLTVFVNYRKNYFGVSSSDVALLQDALEENNEAAIRAKLIEYKEWWAEHKTDEITLP